MAFGVDQTSSRVESGIGFKVDRVGLERRVCCARPHALNTWTPGSGQNHQFGYDPVTSVLRRLADILSSNQHFAFGPLVAKERGRRWTSLLDASAPRVRRTLFLGNRSSASCDKLGAQQFLGMQKQAV